ncbi:MAG: flagellar biosynthesis protein FlhB [Woeseiaceae bacterium]
MAEEQQQQDRTEQPTPKRKADARKKGDVPRSRELTMTGVMLSGAAALIFMATPLTDNIGQPFARSFIFDRRDLFDPGFMAESLGLALGSVIAGLAPLFLVLIIAVFASAVLIGGWSFSMKAAAFKGQRINPISGIKRVFSANSLMELLKALGKFAVVITIAILWLWWSLNDLLSLGMEPLKSAVPHAIRICAISLLIVSTGLLLIAAIDVPFQLWKYQKKLRMTRTEIKDEFKETEGRPEVKSKIRAMQQQAATRRMMEDVPTADVVITNPTHFAVALKYDDSRMGAPRVIAKGKNLIAARIREIAEENKVPLFSAPPLARALYRSTNVGQDIPAGLYTAVAQVLAYIFRLRDGLKLGQQMPQKPEPEIDEDLF